MTWEHHIAAAKLALPPDVHLTGITRIQLLGLDHGPALPVRFVMEGDHHAALENVFLHRTKLLPPVDDVGVTVEAAFIAYCSYARVIDAIKVGDWLLHHKFMTARSLIDLALAHQWRWGADEALWVVNHLNGDSRSLKESETRTVLTFAGLPAPEVNKAIQLDEETVAIGDLVYRQWKVVVEYEGAQHQEDRDQYTLDIDRYSLFRAHGQRYVQVTKEKLANPRGVAGAVYRELLRGGYDGPPPTFGDNYRLLFARVTAAVPPIRRRRSA
jgi:hypothetical protein